MYVHHAIQMLGGVFEPIEPPVEKSEILTTPPSTEDLITIKIEDDIMAVVGTNTWNAIAYGNGKYVAVGLGGYVTTSTDGVNWTTPVQRITASGSTVAGCIFAVLYSWFAKCQICKRYGNSCYDLEII